MSTTGTEPGSRLPVCTSRAVRTLQEGCGPILLCLPHAGGHPGAFRGWSTQLSPDATVLAACYPARLDRLSEAFPAGIPELADEVVDQLPAGDGRPLVVFGHSMGSYVGVEVCERLQAQGRPASALIASGSQAPHRATPRHVVQGGEVAVVQDVIRLNPAARATLDLPELRELILPALMSDYAAVEHYRRASAPALTCRIVAMHGQDDDIASPKEGRQWSECTSAPFRHIVYPGGHFFTESHLSDVLSDIRTLLWEVSPRHPV